MYWNKQNIRDRYHIYDVNIYLLINNNYEFVKAPVTPGLRPCYDLPATEKWAKRRKNVRLVAEVVRLVAEIVGDRKGQISSFKFVVMFKTQSHRPYDQVTTYCDRIKIAIEGKSNEERTTGRRVRTTGRIGRVANQSQQGRWSCSKLVVYRTTGGTLRQVAPPIDCSRWISQLIVRSIFGGHDWY